MAVQQKSAKFTNLGQPHLYGEMGWHLPGSSIQEQVTECHMDSFVIFDGVRRLSLACVSGPAGDKKEKELLSCPVDKNWAAVLNKTHRFSAETIYCHEEPKILKKIADGKTLAWDDLYMLAKLAELGKPSAIAAVKRPLSVLIGRGNIAKTPEALLEVQRALPLLERFWKGEWVDYLVKINEKILPWIVGKEDVTYRGAAGSFGLLGVEKSESALAAMSTEQWAEERRLKNRARELIRSISNLAVEGIEKLSDEKRVSFVLKEILQKPNPENTDAIRAIINGFDRLPSLFRNRAAPYFRKEYNIDTAKESALSYLATASIFPDILVFLYRKAGRIDARLELENQMLQELALHETGALSLYLKEMVVREKDAAAVFRLKEMLAGRVPFVSHESIPLLLHEIISMENGVFPFFEAFLTGRETLEIFQNDKIVKVRFDIGSFFASMEPFFLLPMKDSRDLSREETNFPPDVWKNYQNLMAAAMRRASQSKGPTQKKLFAAVQAHFDRFYSNLDRDNPPWSPWRSQIVGYFPLTPLIVQAMAHAPMRDYLREKVRQGNPFLGHEALIQATDHFQPLVKGESLDAVYERIVIERQRAESDRNAFPLQMTHALDVETLQRRVRVLRFHDFERAEEFLLRGLQTGDPAMKYIFTLLATAAVLRSPKLYSLLSTQDVAFIPELAEQHCAAGFDREAVMREVSAVLEALKEDWNHPHAGEARNRLKEILESR
ncbi:MAG: hypothetical protein Q8P84_07850 [Deltaproteobacteria bacterium]|nr:hypothetical protein [Deltaproteobacteria bacterium]MDZ4224678.1 hypothetical protein [bacterium]